MSLRSGLASRESAWALGRPLDPPQRRSPPPPPSVSPTSPGFLRFSWNTSAATSSSPSGTSSRTSRSPPNSRTSSSGARATSFFRRGWKGWTLLPSNPCDITAAIVLAPPDPASLDAENNFTLKTRHGLSVRRGRFGAGGRVAD